MGLMGLLILPSAAQAWPWGKHDEKPKEQGLYERLTRFYSWNDPKAPKTGYETKKFETGGMYSGKSYGAGEYAGAKMYDVKPFDTKTFEGSKKNWLGNLLFPSKKLPDNLGGSAKDAGKTFETKQAPVKEFADNGRKSPLGSKGEYETASYNMKGRTQGAIDNDMHLQEKVKKGLTVDDVKKLLNGAH
jgi:hypothetical protein